MCRIGFSVCLKFAVTNSIFLRNLKALNRSKFYSDTMFREAFKTDD